MSPTTMTIAVAAVCLVWLGVLVTAARQKSRPAVPR
jgi:hypothetical protein